MIICKNLNGKDEIITLKEWREKCPPERGDYHWQDGRSAKELAKEWINNKGKTLRDLLNQCPDFQGINFIKASPEFETRFDKFGRGRKHDLLIIGEKENKIVLISIEAKVDESFGNDTVGTYYTKAIIKRLNGTITKVPSRIEGLIQALFKRPYPSKIIHLQYQLLHAVAGTLTEAKKRDAAKAIFIVHTLRASSMNAKKNKINDANLDNFVDVISAGVYKGIRNEIIVGPISVYGNAFIPSNIPLYIGKI